MVETTTILPEIFDTTKEPGTTEPIPVGQYVASIFNAELKPLKSGKGQGVNLTWDIEGGDHAGRRIFDLVIIAHENADTMRIGRGKLKDICVATGVTGTLTDLSAICHKECWVTVKIESDKTGQYPDKNRVARVKPIAKANVVKLAAKASGTDGKPFEDEIPF
jgi:hypothetical protein